MSTQGNRPGALRISGTGMPGGTTVELDGRDVSRYLRGAIVRLDAGHLPTVTLDVVVHDLSAETAETHVVIPDETRELLTRLGWTPPEGETC